MEKTRILMIVREREELREIKTALDRLEGANTFDIYAESEPD